MIAVCDRTTLRGLTQFPRRSSQAGLQTAELLHSSCFTWRPWLATVPVFLSGRHRWIAREVLAVLDAPREAPLDAVRADGDVVPVPAVADRPRLPRCRSPPSLPTTLPSCVASEAAEEAVAAVHLQVVAAGRYTRQDGLSSSGGSFPWFRVPGRIHVHTQQRHS